MSQHLKVCNSNDFARPAEESFERGVERGGRGVRAPQNVREKKTTDSFANLKAVDREGSYDI